MHSENTAYQRNIVFERHQFWSLPMPEGVNVDQFVSELRQKCKNCEFGVTENDMIREKRVFTVPDVRVKERLLREMDLTLDKAVDICRAAEVAKSQLRAMRSAQPEASVEALHKVAASSEKGRVGMTRQIRPPIKSRPQAANGDTCRKCGGTHKPRQCPAFGVLCHNCNKKNHYAKVCSSSQKRGATVRGIHDLEVESLFIGTMSCAPPKNKHQDNAWYITANIKNKVVRFKLDTGADANVLPLSILQKIPGPHQLQPTRVALVAYGGSRLKPEGTVSLTCDVARTKTDLQFFITKLPSTPILGRDACEQLNLVKRLEAITIKAPATREELVDAYPSVFSGLGQFPGVHHIHTDPHVTPVVHGCRKIPIAVMDRLKATLEELVVRDVIAPVTEPTEWVNSLVITEKKNGSLRVCLDPRDLNVAIKRQHFSIPTPEEVLHKLSGKTIFSILDEKDGYWQVRLDTPSSMLCTFSTPWGRFRFKRLPFGIKSASEVFQQRNSETFGDIEGVHIIADDMIIAAASEEEHDAILQKVMDAAQKNNVKFNKDKIQYKVDSVRYMGHVVTSKGVKPDESKVLAIRDMPLPEDKKGLQRLLGMTRYLCQYIPNEAMITSPLRDLLRKDAAWHWSHEHTAALDKLKKALMQAPVLQFYDQSKPLTIQCDASKDGLGACLLQEGSLLPFLVLY
ncbi:uncharacterized protein K02A2.6 isoform X2 [Corythoichthys intestinalis]|uniref:uncharacterized protein K02A2.6 isoform X2 n=1 Tax=Corythoichthys intestinalis TaxID=161448 RepID=UPI0025A57FDA|nr:uncharacterized protein K02A2.6 isoform X2 [Corythoichthys intestinalis]